MKERHAMNNPIAVTVDLPPRLLNLLESYVRARSATHKISAQIDELKASPQKAEDQSYWRAYHRSAYIAAENEEQRLADLTLFKLILELRELGVGTLGDALNEYWLNQTPPKPGTNTRTVLYVYRCTACGHVGNEHLPESTPEVTVACSGCGEAVQAEWDGGVELTANAEQRNKR